ncbi:SusC/RagA family TonB-linked outer membrane protein [Sphingobacterium daejeonense]|uniref:SusC/RagA family TonB-linked outer membrane protein n=1 Tax=Sphingobacterium daejeonense TaxID=371142 RepID=UPI0021A2C825|nr:SusC/RagA family TonB-linked outer membrane protein [Sphingobacterium daejeonense]MCT1531886.1 SusC/RagA family TonB-linked outer membrane protein [Sphingobacterium daejeonense]
MKQKLLSFILLFTICIGLVNAQNQQVSGKVTSDDGGTPLAGVTVNLIGTSVTTQTDASGNFSISAPGSGSLRFTNIGYVGQTVNINNSSVINVTLISDEAALDEIVVTGYSNIKKTEFSGAASIISNREIEDKPVANLTQNLQGRVPGLLANSGTGQPGSAANVQIRGTKSIQGAGAQPLYIVDGIPASSETVQNLNPNDFESMTVLKDASAAALYGARGGVGVIVITTKQGKKGTSEVSVRTQFGVTAPPDFSRLNLMSTAELLAYEERVGLITGSTNAGFSNVPGWFYSRLNPANSKLSAAQLAEYDRKLDSTRNINTDIGDLLFRNGISQTYELNLRGGAENLTYFSSIGYMNQDGVDRFSDFERFTGRLNLGYTKGKFTAQFNNSFGYSITHKAPGDGFGNSPLSPFQMIYRAKPYDNPYLPDGSLNFGGGGTNLNLKNLANLFEANQNTRWSEKTWKINSGLILGFQITDDISIKNVTGIDADNGMYEYYINPNSYRGSLQNFQSGIAREANTVNAQIINTSSINYNKTFNDVHKVDVGAYFEGIRVYNKGMGFTLYNLNPSLPWTGQGANPLPTNDAETMPQNSTSARSGYGIRSYFATAAYDYAGKYNISANVRRDGTSRIVNIDNREITTWSAGATWNIIQEEFMKTQTLFTDLRLRASYGQAPNIGSIAINAYNLGLDATGAWWVPNYISSQVPGYGTAAYPGSTIPGIAPTTPGNPNLKIETVNKANIGLDFNMWANRARFTFDIYQEMTNDLFVSQPLSNTTGFNSMNINAGKMSNKGIEAVIAVDAYRTDDIDLTVGWNHAINVNKIEDLGAVTQYESGTYLIKEGLPFGSHYTYNYLGADPETGRPMYYAQDGETIVYDLSNAGRFATFGTYKPKHIGGFNLDFRYKAFSLSTLFSYQFDVVRSNNIRNWITDGTRGYIGSVNQSRELLDNQWEKPGDEKYFSSPVYSKGFTSSDLQNAKFLRFRNLTLNYRIPGITHAGVTYLKGANVYFTAHNLAVWSPWTGVDPEDDNNISLNEYPNPKSFVFGINFNF